VLLVPGVSRAVTAPFGAGAATAMLVAALLQLAFLYLSSALRAHGRFGAVSRAQSLQALAGGGIGIALLWKWGVWGLIAGWIAGTLAAVAWMARAIPEAPGFPAAPREGLALVERGCRSSASTRCRCCCARVTAWRSCTSVTPPRSDTTVWD